MSDSFGVRKFVQVANFPSWLWLCACRMYTHAYGKVRRYLILGTVSTLKVRCRTSGGTLPYYRTLRGTLKKSSSPSRSTRRCSVARYSDRYIGRFVRTLPTATARHFFTARHLRMPCMGRRLRLRLVSVCRTQDLIVRHLPLSQRIVA